jgi:hypothetical protein
MFRLDISLFERLVLAGYPHASLAVQHRMHPEVSALVKHTYPALKDHPKVAAHPPVKGLGSRLVFIDHRHPELQDGRGQRVVWGYRSPRLSDSKLQRSTGTRWGCAWQWCGSCCSRGMRRGSWWC